MMRTPNMNAVELIEELELEIAKIRRQLCDLKQKVWESSNQLEDWRERASAFEQLANPEDDGHPYSETLRV
jgi:hypothetical protein